MKTESQRQKIKTVGSKSDQEASGLEKDTTAATKERSRLIKPWGRKNEGFSSREKFYFSKIEAENMRMAIQDQCRINNHNIQISLSLSLSWFSFRAERGARKGGRKIAGSLRLARSLLGL